MCGSEGVDLTASEPGPEPRQALPSLESLTPQTGPGQAGSVGPFPPKLGGDPRPALMQPHA